MEAKITRKIVVDIDITLDSSETIMFTKGGKHETSLSLNEIFYNEIPLSDYEINLSFQLEREQQSRYDFINQEANAHKARQVNENQHS